ncbi:MAG: Mannosylglucosyl-3-phosphoglycerate phosphatase [Dehalococcoidia bacterium]|nr:Mannosylglucosyl-3-phosphoglycerate phosphatase [Bacillota bacterium]
MLLTLVPILLAISLVVAGSPVSVAEGINPVREQGTTITILHTGDIHGHLDPPWRAEEGEYIGGIARIATLVNQIRAEQPNTILLDAGDTIHGTSVANLFKGKPVIEVMNAMGYTAMVVGNHDFNFGLKVLQERANQAKFPILGANVRYRTGVPVPFLPPYTIVEVGGLRIGIIGLATARTPILTHPKNVVDLEFLDEVTVARKFVKQLAPQVDLIVVLNHMGIGAAAARLPEVHGIAVAVTAHCHTQILKEVGNTILVSSGHHSEVLGRLDIVVEDGIVTSFTHEFLPTSLDIKKDAAIEGIIKPYREAVQVAMAEVIGVTTILLDRGMWWEVFRETNMGNLVADVMRKFTGADIAIQNSGGLRANIPVGPITLGDIFTALPFDNNIVVLELTGAEIRRALEHGVSQPLIGGGAFPQVSGMSFTFDPARPPGERIFKVTIGGLPLELARTYRVATNCFLAAGGDGYTMFINKVRLDTGIFLRDAVAAHIRVATPIHPRVEGRVKGV